MPDHSSELIACTHTPTQAPCSSNRPLVPCIYVGLQCPFCGDVRQALADLPSSPAVSCPRCGTSCAFVQLGSGSTRRTLPFFEIPRPNTKLMFRSDEVPPEDAPLSVFRERPDHARYDVTTLQSSARTGVSRRRSTKPYLSG